MADQLTDREDELEARLSEARAQRERARNARVAVSAERLQRWLRRDPARRLRGLYDPNLVTADRQRLYRSLESSLSRQARRAPRPTLRQVVTLWLKRPLAPGIAMARPIVMLCSLQAPVAWAPDPEIWRSAYLRSDAAIAWTLADGRTVSLVWPAEHALAVRRLRGTEYLARADLAGYGKASATVLFDRPVR